MTLKASALKTYLQLVTRWMDFTKTLDRKGLRFAAANFKLYAFVLTGGLKGSDFLIRRFNVTADYGTPLTSQAETHDIDLKCKPTADAIQSAFEPNIQRHHACLITVIRKRPLGRLTKTLRNLGMRHARLSEVIPFIGAHKRVVASADVYAVETPPGSTDPSTVYILRAKKEKHGRTSIELLQGNVFARRADNMPMVPFGTRLLVIYSGHREPLSSAWEGEDGDGE